MPEEEAAAPPAHPPPAAPKAPPHARVALPRDARPRYFEPAILDVIVVNYKGTGYAGSSLPHGQGKALFKHGHTYEGTWVGGRMHGRGTYTWVDGVRYEGDFVHGKASGRGTYTWPTGGRYEGDIVDGKRHGNGTMVFADSPATYVGTWAYGKRSGKGVMKFDAEGKERYEGDWKNDQKTGQGTMYYESGSVYQGSWVGDQKCGHGVMTWVTDQGVETYEGAWDKGMPNGVGEQTWELVAQSTQHQMKNRYNGAFKDGYRHGFGIFHYATGARYEGQWAYGVKQGVGVFSYEDGTKYTGRFEDNHAVEELETNHDVMDIDDLLAEESNPAEQLRRSSAVLLRFTSDLRVIYRHYAFLPCLWVPGGGRDNDRTVEGIRRGKTFTISGRQFRRFLLDADLLSPDMPLARANRIAARLEQTCTSTNLWRAKEAESKVQLTWDDVVIKEDDNDGKSETMSYSYEGSDDADDIDDLGDDVAPADEGLESNGIELGGYSVAQLMQFDPHSPDHEILYRDFLEILVRIAQARYRKQGQMIHARLMKFIEEDVLPKATKVPEDAFRNELMEVECLMEFKDVLLKMYDEAVRKTADLDFTTTRVENSDHPVWQTTTVQGVLMTLLELQLLMSFEGAELIPEDSDLDLAGVESQVSNPDESSAITYFEALNCVAEAIFAASAAEEMRGHIATFEATVMARKEAEAEAARIAAEEAAALKDAEAKGAKAKAPAPEEEEEEYIDAPTEEEAAEEKRMKRSEKKARIEARKQAWLEEKEAIRAAGIARAAVEETARRRSAAAAVPHVVQMMNIEVTYTEFVEILCRVGRTASKGVVGREEAPLDIQLQFWLGEVETRISGSYGDEVVA